MFYKEKRRELSQQGKETTANGKAYILHQRQLNGISMTRSFSTLGLNPTGERTTPSCNLTDAGSRTTLTRSPSRAGRKDTLGRSPGRLHRTGPLTLGTIGLRRRWNVQCLRVISGLHRTRRRTGCTRAGRTDKKMYAGGERVPVDHSQTTCRSIALLCRRTRTTGTIGLAFSTTEQAEESPSRTPNGFWKKAY